VFRSQDQKTRQKRLSPESKEIEKELYPLEENWGGIGAETLKAGEWGGGDGDGDGPFALL